MLPIKSVSQGHLPGVAIKMIQTLQTEKPLEHKRVHN